MAKFAVYYVPPGDGELYRLGSSVLGYDVRRRQTVEQLEGLRRVPGFSGQWLQKASQYGFHLTIGDSIDFDPEDLGRIEGELDGILKCFNPASDFTLRRRGDDFVTFWGSAVVLRYEPNDHLKVLHSVIAARMHPLGTGSGYLQRHLANPEKEADRPYRVQRMLRFYSPTIFDSYSPHFTLLHPHSGESKAELRELFTDTFARFGEVALGSICLLVQSSAGENWRIYREFPLGGRE